MNSRNKWITFIIIIIAYLFGFDSIKKWIKLILIIVVIIGSASLYLGIYYYYIFQRPAPVINNGAGVDKFGIKEMYPTKPGGEEWYMNINDPNNDPKTNPKTTLIKSDDSVAADGGNSWKIHNSEVRYEVFTSSGFQPNLITTLNQTELSKKGYMQSPNDWKNIEMTGYFKINRFTNSETNGAAHIELVARGGKNTNDKTLLNGNNYFVIKIPSLQQK